MTFASSAPDTSGQRRGPATSTTVDAVCGDLTVTFDIRYVDGPAGDRLAAAQARAIYALLEWIAHQDAATGHTN
jgi:phospholipase C